MEQILQLSRGIPDNDSKNEEYLFSQDSTHLRRILPDTVWRLLTLHKLGNCSETTTNLANSSPFFRDLSLSQRTKFLFEDVLNVTSLSTWQEEDQEVMSFANLLKCREVCSHWNAVVDKLLQGKFIPAKLPNSLTGLPRSITTNEFVASSQEVTHFLAHFEATHSNPEVVRNPFIWNSLSVVTCNEGNGLTDFDHEFLNSVSSALHKYGQFIHEFKLEISGWAFYLEDALKIQDWLAHMPNLKSLNICDETPSLEWNIDLVEFEDQLVAANFPPFTKLRNLDSVQFRGVRAPIFNRFIQQNHHISKLLLTKCDDEYNFFNLPFQNLVSFDTDIDSAEMFEKLNTSSQVQWPMVKNLTIFICPNEIPSFFVPLSEILKMIEDKFTCRLNTLALQFPKARNAKEANSIWMDSLNFRLYLPSLMGVMLTMSDPISLDFLLEMKDRLGLIFLEILYPTKGIMLKIKNWVSRRNSAIVQFNGYENKIQASNIPKLFTSLDKIGISFGLDEGLKWHDV